MRAEKDAPWRGAEAFQPVEQPRRGGHQRAAWGSMVRRGPPRRMGTGSADVVVQAKRLGGVVAPRRLRGGRVQLEAEWVRVSEDFGGFGNPAIRESEGIYVLGWWYFKSTRTWTCCIRHCPGHPLCDLEATFADL